MRGRLACLVYHRVADPGELPYLTRGGSPAISAVQLERELTALVRIGARFGTFGDLRAGWFPGPREIGVIVSFDDGFRSTYEAGIEVLGRLGVPAVVFQATGMIGAPRLIWEHALYWFTRDPETERKFAAIARRSLGQAWAIGGGPAAALRDRATGPKIEEMLDAARAELGDAGEPEEAARAYPVADHLLRARERGHEIASHGHAHYRRDTLDDAAFEADLERSVRVLAAILGEPPAAYAYPFGSSLPGDSAITGRWFRQAAIVGRRPIERDTDPLRIPRFPWPGPPRGALRERRWLLTGTI